MFLVRRIFADVLPANRHALEQLKSILREQFESLDRRKIDHIEDLLRHPFQYGYRSILCVAEDHRSKVRGVRSRRGAEVWLPELPYFICQMIPSPVSRLQATWIWENRRCMFWQAPVIVIRNQRKVKPDEVPEETARKIIDPRQRRSVPQRSQTWTTLSR